jgi:hypothetical protein
MALSDVKSDHWPLEVVMHQGTTSGECPCGWKHSSRGYGQESVMEITTYFHAHLFCVMVDAEW